MPRAHKSANLVSVRTSKPWNRIEFFVWLDSVLSTSTIPHVSRLAEEADISPSTISNWKTGKQRPTLDKLEAIANVLGVPRSVVWAKAGLLGDDDLSAAAVNLSESVGISDSVTGIVTEASADDRMAIAQIRASKLSKPMQDRLIADHLDAVREAREAHLRRLQKQIDMLEAGE